MTITREWWMATARPRVEAVTLRQDGGDGHCLVLRGSELNGVLAMFAEASAGLTMETAARLVVLCSCDADGNRLFADGDDAAVLNGCEPSAVLEFATEAMRVNRLTSDEARSAEGN